MLHDRNRRRNRNFIHRLFGERTSLKKPYGLNLLIQGASLCLALACAGGTRTNQEIARGEVAVLASRILDPATAQYSGPSAVIIRGTRIVDVIPRARFNRSQVDSVIDLGAMTVLPGLIDAHVHLGIGGPYARNAKADLDAGFTTVADLGSRTNRMLRIRDSINAGSIPGPRVLAAGVWIGTKGGVCEFNGLGISGGADLFKQRVIENATAGADLIKVCVSGWPAASFAEPDKYEIADDALEAVVKEAHARGMKVVAHDISAGGIRAGIKYVIDGLAHTGYLDDALAADLARHNIYMITTLASLTGRDTSAVGRGLIRSIAAASKANVMLVMGTDGGVLPHGRNADELFALAQAGLKPEDAIRAATINAAKALGIQDSVGRIAKGMSADLIAVEGDPMSDISIFAKVKHVMLRGRLIR
jgi:imidazolonepropionase-like amidohydrolase